MLAAVAVLRLSRRLVKRAGTGRATVPGSDVREVLETACERYGEQFAAVVSRSKVWVNGEPASPNDPVRDEDEVAVLPPSREAESGRLILLRESLDCAETFVCPCSCAPSFSVDDRRGRSKVSVIRR